MCWGFLLTTPEAKLVMPEKVKKVQAELVLKDAKVRPVPATQAVAAWAFNRIKVTLKSSK